MANDQAPDDVKTSSERGADHRAGSEDGHGEERVVLVPVQILFEQFVLNVPYDEAPMRVYELSEDWEEAANLVLKPRICRVKEAFSQLAALSKRGGGRVKVESPLRKRRALYIEVSLEFK